VAHHWAALGVLQVAWLGQPGALFLDTAPARVSHLSLHDALPISAAARPCRPGGRGRCSRGQRSGRRSRRRPRGGPGPRACGSSRSEEHTSELQSREKLVCRLLLEKKDEATFVDARSLELEQEREQ